MTGITPLLVHSTALPTRSSCRLQRSTTSFPTSRRATSCSLAFSIQQVCPHSSTTSPGILFGYAGSRGFPLLSQRLLVYHSLCHIGLVAGGASLFFLPYYRLTGFWDNGLRWKSPMKPKKFDFTSRFEEQTIWRHFKIKDY